MSAPTGNTFFSHKKVVLAPAEHTIVNVTGSTFACTESNGGFEMSFDDGEWFPFDVGLKVRFPRPDFFTKLGFRNPGNAEVTFEFVTTSGEIIDARLNVVRDRPLQLQVVDYPTILKTHAISMLTGNGNAGDRLAMPNLVGGGYAQRKAALITNNDPTLDLEVYELVGGVAAGHVSTVFARQVHALPTSADLILVNENATPVNCRASEIYYPAEA
jgi:hypothetical protein